MGAAPSNPIQVASASFIGYRNSTNTESLRDLGFMGNIGMPGTTAGFARFHTHVNRQHVDVEFR